MNSPSPRPDPPAAQGSRSGQNDACAIPVPSSFVEEIARRAAELIAERAEVGTSSPFLTVEEAAEYLRCKPKRIYDLTSQRRLPFVKDGSRTLLRRVDLDAYVEDQA